jgi:hypothetical protein
MAAAAEHTKDMQFITGVTAAAEMAAEIMLNEL